MSYLSRLFLDSRSRAVRRDLADCQQLHRTLLRAFPAMSPDTSGARAGHGVLYRVERTAPGAPVTVLVQSNTRPDWSLVPPDILLPSRGELPNPVCRDLEPFWGSLAPGDRLRFRLRANPTKKVDTRTGPDGVRRNGRRVALTAELDQLAWLERKAAAGGFSVAGGPAGDHAAQNVVVIPEAQQTGARGRRDNAHRASPDRLTFGAVLYEGILTVTDVAAFLGTLRSGIGSGKAYGFGLLSIARVDP